MFVKKLLQYAIVLFVAVTINFILPRLAPGDPLLSFYDEGTLRELSDAERQHVLATMGLDGTLFHQYIDYLKGIATFNLGESIQYSRPVIDVILDYLPWTIVLVLPAMLLSAVIGILIGAYSAWNRGKKRDTAMLTTMLTFQAVPGFWIGMVLIALFAVNLGWFPTFGAKALVAPPSVFGQLKDIAWHLVLPITTLCIATVGSNYLLTRSSMLESLGQDYIILAEAKGVRKVRLILNHGLRNAFLPVYTHIMMGLGTLIGGAVVIESVFSYPGIGSLLYGAVNARDFILLQGIFLFITMGIIIANIMADITYPFIDPRTKKLVKKEEGF
ncbi:ABC transporter permease [Kurthia sibirica]|uniref:ABC transporter permease n=2 Tax=Kurthia sibirica TaxID=202750 RepID=A0A2U3AJV3_9BACL|nr:ABC transporter permease [Kurthia sibirica]